MKYLHEYRDASAVHNILHQIERAVTRHWVLMEVCGGQTHSLIRYGLDKLLPEEIELVHGPGCPVCVTPLEMIDRALALAARPDIIFTSYGDMLRVPGSFAVSEDGSATANDLFSVKSRGGDIRIVYSPLDALQVARENPDKTVVFFAIGFETTAPANAMAVQQAYQEGLDNFCVLASHVTVPPAITAIMESPDTRVNAFLAAGHVCTIMGTAEYQPLAEKYHTPIVVTGFEPLDLAYGILRAVQQLEDGRSEVENAYPRTAPNQGNPTAQAVIEEIFEKCDRPWRGLGPIPNSGYRLREKYAAIDAERRFPAVGRMTALESTLCQSGQVLQGLLKPDQCPAFGRQCTPLTPLGATMVSSEGACAAYYKYGRLTQPPITQLPMTTFTCPTPLRRYPQIVMGHGSGGQMMNDLITHLFASAFGEETLGDAAVFQLNGFGGEIGRLAFTTDTFVVSPLIFPGGDIGSLAVHGTVNDLAVMGARPLYLSAGFVLEEGLPMDTLGQIVTSMAAAAESAGVKVITGDTKVVERGHGDGLYINTSGIGLVPPGINPSPERAQPGDILIINGTLGDHGIAIMSKRAGLQFETEIRSDSAALHQLTAAMLAVCPDIHTLRDLTRGGLAAAANELAQTAAAGMVIEETAVPLQPAVAGACEMLGLDPLHVANEGKLLAVVPPDSAEAVLAAMRAHPLGQEAAVIGHVTASHPGIVVGRTAIGSRRVIDLPAGELLPRIC